MVLLTGISISEFIELNKIVELLSFLFNIIYFYIPCILGTILSLYFKKKNPDEKLKIVNVLLYGITPSILLVMAEKYIRGTNFESEVLIGIAFFAGVFSDVITDTCLSLRKISFIFVKIFKFSDKIKEVAKELEEFNKEIDDNNSSNEKSSNESKD
jgi:uncharacterized membrane protein YbhN (UPF0104 family)